MDLNLPRRVEPEVLDGLAAEDPRAQRSRGDLRRIHRAMATLSIVQRALDRCPAGFRPRTLLELGAGDGSLMLRLALQRSARWPDVRVTLLDRLNPVAASTLDGLRKSGWTPRVVTADAFEWLAGAGDARWDLVFASLFLHHLSSQELSRLLAEVAARSPVFLCCEPRRSVLPLAGSHLVGLLGAGSVARQDAVSSVHAGFRGHELSELWPDPQAWLLQEYPAGLFSHCFLAVRREGSR
jgi:hypothetical protein